MTSSLPLLKLEMVIVDRVILEAGILTPTGFAFGSYLLATFPACHQSWDCCEASKLNFKVPVLSDPAYLCIASTLTRAM